MAEIGATVVAMPAIRIEPLAAVPGLDAALADLGRYDWAIFTSANGVELYWKRLRELGLEAGQRKPRAVAAIGPGTTRALQLRGVEPDYVPAEHTGEALAHGLPDVAGRRVLLPRAAGSRPELPSILQSRGAIVDEFAVYRVAPERPESGALRELAAGVEAITFTSPSTVTNFLAIAEAAGLRPFAADRPPVVACIGPVTAAAAERAGLQPAIVARRFTAAGLVEALVEHFNGGGTT